MFHSTSPRELIQKLPLCKFRRSPHEFPTHQDNFANFYTSFQKKCVSQKLIRLVQCVKLNSLREWRICPVQHGFAIIHGLLEIIHSNTPPENLFKLIENVIEFPKANMVN